MHKASDAPARGISKIETELPGVLLIEVPKFADARGAFVETFHEAKFAALGIRDRFVQDNQSTSVRGCLRGLHYQLKSPQAKLCRVISGEVFDVVVDIRRGSPSFGRSMGVKLSAASQQQIYIPAGFAHGFVVLSERADFAYKCSDFYRPDDEYGIAWNDPGLGIQWPVSSPLLSPKDAALPRLSDIAPDRLPDYMG